MKGEEVSREEEARKEFLTGVLGKIMEIAVSEGIKEGLGVGK